MGRVIQRGTVSQTWANVELSGRGYWTVAHFMLNGIPATLGIGTVESSSSTPIPLPFSEGDEMIVSGEMSDNVFDVEVAYLPRQRVTISSVEWLAGMILGTVSIVCGLPFMALALRGATAFSLMGATLIVFGLWLMTQGISKRATGQRLRSMAGH